ncbi:MAG: T9SS type A sorting domain-containing protein [bacterium]
MKSTIRNVLLVLVLWGVCLPTQVAAQNKIKNSVFGSGGTVVSNSSNRIYGTVGQTFVGTIGGASILLQSGIWFQNIDIITSVEQIASPLLPKEFRLDQNYPNPFNPTTVIQFAVPKRSRVSLKLYDVLGREIATLVDEEFQPGEYKVDFKAKGLASGIYFYRIQAEGFVQTRKLTLLK